MGTKYRNIVVGAGRSKVIGFLRYFRHTAYVAPPSVEHPTVSIVCPDEGYADDSPEPRDTRALAAEISDKLSCAALWSLCDDGDQWVYELWVRGELADQFESPRTSEGHECGDADDDRSSRSPPKLLDWTPERDAMHLPDETWADDSADDEPPWHRAESTGDATELCRAFGQPDQTTAVAAVLCSVPDRVGRFACASDYHRKLAALLGWPARYLCESYSGLLDCRRQGLDAVDGPSWTPTGNAD